jgi:hypothetical protein
MSQFCFHPFCPLFLLYHLFLLLAIDHFLKIYKKISPSFFDISKQIIFKANQTQITQQKTAQQKTI